MKYSKFYRFKQDPFVLKNNIVTNKHIFANWKMNFTLTQAVEFCQLLTEQDQEILDKIVLAPPSIYLGLIHKLFAQIQLSSQDVSRHDQDYGALTGECSAKILKDAGASYAIIGHYERRKYCLEGDDLIFAKALSCTKQGIKPIICFGEENMSDNVLTALQNLINKLPHEQNAIYAYEPYWAIGNKDLDPQILTQKVVDNILQIKSYAKQKNLAINLIYGGSVNSQNIVQLNNIPGLVGFLVGGASLNLVELLKIVKSI